MKAAVLLVALLATGCRVRHCTTWLLSTETLSSFGITAPDGPSCKEF